ncbi:MAG: transcriptional regulator, TetR family [Actinomycetia bacterium]|nr:transcriptional regulator, TetR family [Actinomycetes bacterium]
MNVRSVGTGSVAPETTLPATQPDRRAQRRAARRAENRTDILDAAERVFGEHGVSDGSLRQIAHLSGFSPAAIYLFFENKQHLLAETLARREGELVVALRTVAESDLSPFDKLHHIVDVGVAFFEAHPDFRRLVRRVTGGAVVGSALAGDAGDADRQFMEAMTLLAGIIAAGQEAGEIRAGDAYAMAHLFSVLISEHVLLGAGGEPGVGILTPEQFHGLVDGALRHPR